MGKNTFDRFCDHNMLYIVSQCLHFLVYLPIFIIVDIYKTKSNIYVCNFVNLFIFLLLIIWIIQQGHFCLIILNVHFKVLSHICMHIIILYNVYYITIDIIFLNFFQLDTMQTPYALWANLHPLPFASMLSCIIYIHFKPQKTFFLPYWSVINT